MTFFYTAIEIFIIIIFCTIASLQDIKNQRVNNFLLTCAVFASFINHLIFNFENILFFILSAVVMFMILFFVRFITHKKLGMADVLFGIFQGSCFFVQYIWICILIEVVAAFLIERKRAGKNQFAFIPYMSAGLVGAFVFSVLQLF